VSAIDTALLNNIPKQLYISMFRILDSYKAGTLIIIERCKNIASSGDGL
jgi:hypothetical protein